MTTIALIISMILTALTPIMSDISVWALYANRLLVGIAGVCEIDHSTILFLNHFYISLQKTGCILSSSPFRRKQMGTTG